MNLIQGVNKCFLPSNIFVKQLFFLFRDRNFLAFVACARRLNQSVLLTSLERFSLAVFLRHSGESCGFFSLFQFGYEIGSITFRATLVNSHLDQCTLQAVFLQVKVFFLFFFFLPSLPLLRHFSMVYFTYHFSLAHIIKAILCLCSIILNLLVPFRG